jgi:hypothetical protein
MMHKKFLLLPIFLAALLINIICAHAAKGRVGHLEPPVDSPDLVAYYPLDGDANDLSGKANHGSTFGGVSYLPGKISQAASYDGTTGHISIADSPSLRLKTFTIAAWINLTAFGGRGRIVEKGVSTSYYLYLNDNAQPLVGFYDGVYHDLVSPTSLQINTWYFIAGTYDGTVLKLYLNGALVNAVTVSSAPFQTSDPLVVGWKFNGIGIDHFSGLIDELRIYNAALSESQIQELCNGSTSIGH